MRFSLLPGIAATPLFAEIVTAAIIPLSNGGGKRILNVFHFRQTSTPALGVLATLTTSFLNVYKAALANCVSSAWPASDVLARWLDEAFFEPAVTGATLVGAVTGQRLPLYNTLFLELRTGFSGRSYRGSKHVAPIAESSTESDQFTAGAIIVNDALAAALAACTNLDGGNGTTWDLTVISPTLSDFSVSPRLFSGADVTSVTASPVVGTMKRRKEKRGVA